MTNLINGVQNFIKSSKGTLKDPFFPCRSNLRPKTTNGKYIDVSVSEGLKSPFSPKKFIILTRTTVKGLFRENILGLNT